MSQTDVAAVTDDLEVGPIDYLVVEWPPGTPPNGKALPLFVDLVDRGIVRVLDLVFVQKHADGSVTRIELADLDLDGNPELSIFEGAASGLVGDEDLAEAGSVIQEESSAALLVYENTWAAPFATALRQNGAQLVAAGRIPINAIISALDELEAAEA